MNKMSITLLMMVALVPLAAFIAWKWFKIFNSPDGERFMKRRVQGPYVPLSADENAADEARKL
jgi:hypothetical protein